MKPPCPLEPTTSMSASASFAASTRTCGAPPSTIDWRISTPGLSPATSRTMPSSQSRRALPHPRSGARRGRRGGSPPRSLASPSAKRKRVLRLLRAVDTDDDDGHGSAPPSANIDARNFERSMLAPAQRAASGRTRIQQNPPGSSRRWNSRESPDRLYGEAPKSLRLQGLVSYETTGRRRCAHRATRPGS